MIQKQFRQHGREIATSPPLQKLPGGGNGKHDGKDNKIKPAALLQRCKPQKDLPVVLNRFFRIHILTNARGQIRAALCRSADNGSWWLPRISCL